MMSCFYIELTVTLSNSTKRYNTECDCTTSIALTSAITAMATALLATVIALVIFIKHRGAKSYPAIKRYKVHPVTN